MPSVITQSKIGTATQCLWYKRVFTRSWVVWFSFLAANLLLISSCDAGPDEMTTSAGSSLSGISPAVWKKLAEKRIYFGHQSVGDNIILGLRKVLAEHPEVGLRVQAKPELIVPTKPLFVHSYIGENENPSSKNLAFADALRNKFRGNIDIAFFKYCFVDIGATSDVEKIFGEYQRTMADLKKHYPNIMLLYFTVPLTTVQTGWKAWLKEKVGRAIGGYADNIKRNEYNNLLRKEYGSTGLLFDLAKLEATRPDGSLVQFRFDGRVYTSLDPEYSRDGAHLNGRGEKYIAEQLLLFLAQQVARDNNTR